MCPKEGGGDGPQQGNCCEDVKQWVPTPFSSLFSKQQSHQSLAFCCPHAQKSSSHVPPTIRLQASYYFIQITYTQYNKLIC
jgi:hypothetical protein